MSTYDVRDNMNSNWTKLVRWIRSEQASGEAAAKAEVEEVVDVSFDELEKLFVKKK